MPRALILSSCLGGDAGAARAFKAQRRRPQVIFGTEGKHKLTFSGACISWPVLYTELVENGMKRNVSRTGKALHLPDQSRNRCSSGVKLDHVSTGVDAQFRQTPVVSEEKHLCVFRQFTDNLQCR